MRCTERFLLMLVCLSLVLAYPRCRTAAGAEFQSHWPRRLTRTWLGPEYWANPLQDWRISAGRLECLSTAPNRNVHVLTHQLTGESGDLTMQVRLGTLDGKPLAQGSGSAGFRIAISGPLPDFRYRLIHGRGIDAGLRLDGHLFIGNPEASDGAAVDLDRDSVVLKLHAVAKGDRYLLRLSAHDARSGQSLGTTELEVPAERMEGNLALVSHYGAAGRKRSASQFWFADWRIGGSKVASNEDHAFGPVLFAMYTLSRRVMKLTAQMPPLGAGDSQEVHLQIRSHAEQQWRTVGRAAVDPLARTATFRIADWDDQQDWPYRLVYELSVDGGKTETTYYEGVIRHDPRERDEIVVAGFTGHQDYLVPNTVLANNVKKLDPDVLVFTGDQLYEGNAGYGIVRSPVETATLDYLRKWYIFGWSFRDLMRDRVTICMPDDHDVYQGNVWGQGGRAVPSIREHAQGGYAMPAEWVNAVQRTQTSHLPDPFDPTPVEQGITVYYGPMVYGGVGFAILEDRKFKSGPEGKVNDWKGRPDHVTDPNFDPKSVDKPGLTLLGKRQLDFIHQFAADWRGQSMKVALSQTIFANVANYHGPNQMYLVADLDSNGWPQSGRNRALDALRRGFIFHLAGDQHLASVVHHGIETWRDAIVSFCVPSIAAGYPRSWHPEREGKVGANRPYGYPPELGDFLDGLGNHITVWAVGNPAPRISDRSDPLRVGHDKASGFGIVRVDKRNRVYRLECWRLLSDPDRNSPVDQFPGWPRVVTQRENYGRAPVAYLPTLRVHGMTDPVVQVIREDTGEVEYTLRIRGNEFRPFVFAPGRYTVKVGEQEPEQMKTIRAVESVPAEATDVLDVSFKTSS